MLGTVGEPINPEAWMWYREIIGKGRCPIVDTWWQTETGAIMIAPLPGATPTKPGSATKPLPGIEARYYDARTATSVGRKRRRLSRDPQTVAVDAADDLGRR
ncbi:MAG: AMP-binding protein [Pyrinomonadaceae bacterium]